MADDVKIYIGQVSRALNDLTAQFANMQKEVSSLAKSFSTISKSFKASTTQKELDKLRTGTVKTNKAITKTVKNETKKQESIVFGFFDRMSKRSKQNRFKRADTTSGKIDEFVKMQMLWYPTKALTFAALAIPGSVIKSTMEYGDALRQVSSVAGMTKAELESLNETVKEVGTSTKFSMIEVAQATKTLAQAGFRGAEISAALTPVALLATATGGTIQASVQLTSTIIRAYGKDVSEFSSITDSLANAVVNSKLTIDDLNTSFNYVASAAGAVGVTLDETIALLGTLANSGMKATTAATGLRMVMLKLAAPTKKAEKVLTNAGLTLDDVSIAKRGIKEVLVELEKLSQTDIINIFGARSANAILSLRTVGTEAINLLQRSIEMNGTAGRMASEQLLGLKQSWKVLLDVVTQSSVELGNTFSDELALDIRTLSTWIKELNGGLGELNEKSRETHRLLTSIKVLIGGLITVKTISSFNSLFGTALLTKGDRLISIFGYAKEGMKGMTGAAAKAGGAVRGASLIFSGWGVVIAGVVGGIALLARHLFNVRKELERIKTVNIEAAIGATKFSSFTFKQRSDLSSMDKNAPDFLKDSLLSSKRDISKKRLAETLAEFQTQFTIPEEDKVNLYNLLVKDINSAKSLQELSAGLEKAGNTYTNIALDKLNQQRIDLQTKLDSAKLISGFVSEKEVAGLVGRIKEVDVQISGLQGTSNIELFQDQVEKAAPTLTKLNILFKGLQKEGDSLNKTTFDNYTERISTLRKELASFITLAKGTNIGASTTALLKSATGLLGSKGVDTSQAELTEQINTEKATLAQKQAQALRKDLPTEILNRIGVDIEKKRHDIALLAADLKVLQGKAGIASINVDTENIKHASAVLDGKILAFQTQIDASKRLEESFRSSAELTDMQGKEGATDALIAQVIGEKNKQRALLQAIIDLGVLGPKKTEIEGIRAQLFSDIDKLQEKTDKLGIQIKDSITDSFSGFFQNVIGGTMSVSDAFRNMASNIASSIGQIVSDRLAMKLVDSLLGSATSSGAVGGVFKSAMTAFGMHDGGIVGQDFTFTRSVSPEMFSNAPRFHDGLYPNEFPAILEKDEIVIPKNSGVTKVAPKVTINLTNQSNQQISINTESITEDRDEYIINAVIKNISNNGALRSIL